MVSIRAELWCAAFVRRHNDLGNICVVSRRGDALAGQIWIEVDHLNGQTSLFSQAPGFMHSDEEMLFQCIFDRQDYQTFAKRIAREADFDPDFWLLTLESPSCDHGLDLLKKPA